LVVDDDEVLDGAAVVLPRHGGQAPRESRGPPGDGED
jgi:hypothetical protein